MAALARGRRAGTPIKHSYHAATASSTVADSAILLKKCSRMSETMRAAYFYFYHFVDPSLFVS
jgi:hypothetical protein